MYEIRIKTPHLIAMWWSIKECIEYSDEQGPLIECMDYIATKQKDTKKEYKFSVDNDRAAMIYNCIKFVLDNELPKDEEQLPTFFVAMERIAQVLDMRIIDKMSPMKMRLV